MAQTEKEKTDVGGRWFEGRVARVLVLGGVGVGLIVAANLTARGLADQEARVYAVETTVPSTIGGEYSVWLVDGEGRRFLIEGYEGALDCDSVMNAAVTGEEGEGGVKKPTGMDLGEDGLVWQGEGWGVRQIQGQLVTDIEEAELRMEMQGKEVSEVLVSEDGNFIAIKFDQSEKSAGGLAILSRQGWLMSALSGEGEYITGGEWSPGGSNFAYFALGFNAEGGLERAALVAVRIEDGRVAIIVFPGVGQNDGLWSWSPDGAQIAYASSSGTTGISKVTVVDMATSTPRDYKVAGRMSTIDWTGEGTVLMMGQVDGRAVVQVLDPRDGRVADVFVDEGLIKVADMCG